jgi:hypothetical protein
MNPLVEKILAQNGADIEAIVQAIGVGTLIKLTPHFLAIMKTVQEAQAATPK